MITEWTHCIHPGPEEETETDLREHGRPVWGCTTGHMDVAEPRCLLQLQTTGSFQERWKQGAEGLRGGEARLPAATTAASLNLPPSSVSQEGSRRVGTGGRDGGQAPQDTLTGTGGSLLKCCGATGQVV